MSKYVYRNIGFVVRKLHHNLAGSPDEQHKFALTSILLPKWPQELTSKIYSSLDKATKPWIIYESLFIQFSDEYSASLRSLD